MTTINVHRRWTGKKVSLTISGWILALVFALPYIHMLITALKPLDEVLQFLRHTRPQRGLGTISPECGKRFRSLLLLKAL